MMEEWLSLFKVHRKLEKRAWKKWGIQEYSIYPGRKWGKITSTALFKETEQLHGYSKAQRRVVKDVELSWAPEKMDWIAKEIYDQDY